MKRSRHANEARTNMEILEDFARDKGLPRPGRVAGGGTRRVIYEHPERVKVIRGRNVPYEAVGRLAAEAESRGTTRGELADELFSEAEPASSLAARISKLVTEALHTD